MKILGNSVLKSRPNKNFISFSALKGETWSEANKYFAFHRLYLNTK